ncbi:MAG: glycosyltransferase family 2 protein [Vampirovibrionales bacterium]|nr:glycosyltransferase family 2 protein [Vampirovibrionales bacterium]
MDIIFSIIIPTCNRPEQLLGLLARLREQRDAPPFEVIVVDDSSPHDLKPRIESLPPGSPPIAYLACTQEGPGEARNLGAGVARGEYLVFLDDDCAVSPDWLSELAAVVARSTADIYYGPIQSKLPAIEPFLHTVVMEDDPYRSTQAAFRKTLFHELGGFDPKLSHWSEGWDLVSRARRHGAQVQYLPGWACWHQALRVSPKYGQLGRFWQTMTRMRYLLCQHPESADAYQHLAGYCRLGFWQTILRAAAFPLALAVMSPIRALLAFLLLNLIFDALRLARIQARLLRWKITLSVSEAVSYLLLNWSADLEKAILRVALLVCRLRQMVGARSDDAWAPQTAER